MKRNHPARLTLLVVGVEGPTLPRQDVPHQRQGAVKVHVVPHTLGLHFGGWGGIFESNLYFHVFDNMGQSALLEFNKSKSMELYT